MLSLKRSLRLTRSTDFQRVRQYGKSFAHPLIVLIVLPNQQKSSLFGIVAGRTVGNAVQRNRAKRLLRAAVQAYLPQIAPGWDVVLIARRPIVGLKLDQTQVALLTLLKRANLLQETHD